MGSDDINNSGAENVMTSAIVFEKLLQRMRQQIKPTNKRLASFFQSVLTPLVNQLIILSSTRLFHCVQLLVYAN